MARCPLLERIKGKIPRFEVKGRSLEGPSPPSVFVGRSGYPRITVGPLAPPVQIPLPWRLESQAHLYDMNMEDIYSLRASLYRGRHQLNVKVAKSPLSPGSERLVEIEPNLYPRERKILDSVKDVALSSRAMELEMNSEKDLSSYGTSSTMDSISMPMGPTIDLRGIRLVDNARVERAVDRITGDTDLLASEGALELHSSGIPISHIVRLLSVGLMGEDRNRKLVPTRWSITAVDDLISKRLASGSMELAPLDHYRLYHGSRFGNHFLIALYPPPYRFEMLEQWKPGSLWGGGKVLFDHEGPRGRQKYASRITGAYYAARLSAMEHLHRIRRSAGVSVIRWITDDYWAPMGVWIIRETVKRALEGEPMVFSDRRSLVERIDRLSGIADWKRHSRHLSRPESRRIDDFLH